MGRITKFIIGAALILGWLVAGCTTTGDGSRGRTVVTRTECLPMRDYTPAEQRQAEEELRALPQNSEIAKFVVDYGAMRAANRACRAASGNSTPPGAL